MMKFSAIILAGGKNSRMKQNKALIKLKEKTFIETITDQLEPFFDEIIIITNTPREYDFLPYNKYTDLILNKGPLGGIHSGLIHAKYEYAFVTACDMPLVNGVAAKKLCKMVQGYDGVVPRKGQYLQPLFAVYKKSCISYIKKCLKENSLQIPSFYPYINILYKDWSEIMDEDPDKTFFNVNTPEDLRTLQKYKNK